MTTKITLELTKAEMIHIIHSMNSQVNRLERDGLKETAKGFEKDLIYLSDEYEKKWGINPYRRYKK